jgi:HSP20 family molecular chaperone IbpA
MNRQYKNRKHNDFEFNCGFDPMRIFVKGKHGPQFPFFHFGNRKGNSFFSRAHVDKGEDAYTIRFEIPGVSKGDIQLEITPDELWLNAKNEEFNKNYEEHIFFRDSIDPDKVNAELKAGILIVNAPFANVKPKKRVNVE